MKYVLAAHSVCTEMCVQKVVLVCNWSVHDVKTLVDYFHKTANFYEAKPQTRWKAVTAFETAATITLTLFNNTA
jgi:hypothetical protein